MKMGTQSQFQLFQNIELPPRIELAGLYELIYTFSRSEARQSKNYPGADYLSFAHDGNRLIFSVCDGVNGAFAGYVAAKFIGNKLVNWGKQQKDAIPSISMLENKLSEALQDWTKDGTELVNSTSLLLKGDETDRGFMERRRSKGSQAMFLVGVADAQQNKVFCIGLGDIRMSVKYLSKNEPDLVIGQTKDRWSTLEGKIGNLWSRTYTLSEINGLTVYTDGFEQFVNKSVSIQSKNELNNIALPNDDVTVFSIKLNQKVTKSHKSEAPRYSVKDNEILFDAIDEDEWIRVFVKDEIFEITGSKIPITEHFKWAKKGQIRYQVVGEKTQPSGIELLKLDLPSLQPEKTLLPANIQNRRRPIISHPIPNRPLDHTATQVGVQDASVNTVQMTQKNREGWAAFIASIGWVLALFGWGLAIFFLQIDKRANEIQELNKRIENQQTVIAEYRKTPTIAPGPTALPTITETPQFQKIIMECNVPEGGLSVYQTPKINSLPLYIAPEDRKLFILQLDENQTIEGWAYVSDEALLLNGWINNQDIDLMADCVAR